MQESKPSAQVLAPVVKSVRVGLPLEAAFRLFTSDISRWWPLATHSVGGEKAESCVLEGWVGGRFYEIDQDGSQADWGIVLAWEPPHRLACSFHPGRTPDFAGQLEFAFQMEAGSTRVTLTHQGWERLGELAQAERDAYNRGWDAVLRKYVGEASFKSRLPYSQSLL